MQIIKLKGEAESRRHIHYEVDTSLAPIGVGGMGQVFKGLQTDERTGATRQVAVKFMFDDLLPSAYERARREASIQLRNDNLIEMLGFIETMEADGVGGVKKHYHVISELLEGISLADLLMGKTTDRYGNKVPFAVSLFQLHRSNPEHFARTVAMSVISGLMALHDAGYIHRDIDPSNIMITSNGHIKLIDFGIAKRTSAQAVSERGLTVAGKFMGKPEYAAPELALGDTSHQNPSTDIYAVGILLYQCITGHTPFEGPRHEILQKQLKQKIPLTAIKNKTLRSIIAKACEKRQELRYQSAAEMRVALEESLRNNGTIRDWKKSIRLAAAAATILVLAISVTMVVMNTKPDLEPQPTQLKGVAAACAMMKDPATAQQGLKLLTTLSENNNDADATYLLSRLYFKSRKADDLYPDSVRVMQQNLGIGTNNKRAHELLRKTATLAPHNYFALYELGCDYMGGHARTEAVERDLKTALKYFKQALQYATTAHDNYYMERIQQKIEVFNEGFEYE